MRHEFDQSLEVHFCGDLLYVLFVLLVLLEQLRLTKTLSKRQKIGQEIGDEIRKLTYFTHRKTYLEKETKAASM